MRQKTIESSSSIAEYLPVSYLDGERELKRKNAGSEDCLSSRLHQLCDEQTGEVYVPRVPMHHL